jgi:hypothetical protein
VLVTRLNARLRYTRSWFNHTVVSENWMEIVSSMKNDTPVSKEVVTIIYHLVACSNVS